MLTTADLLKIEKLLDYKFDLWKAGFYTKEEIDQKFDKVYTMLDKFLKPLSKAEEDMIIMRYRMDRTEEWIGKASPKLGLNFKH